MVILMSEPSLHTPKWREIRDDLRRRLAAGEFDAKFPTDRELVDAYEVSRHTVREAVRGLTDEGLITRRRGRGSHRTPRSFSQPTGALYSLFQSVEETGAVQTSIVISQEVARNEEAAKILDLPTDTELFYLERTRLADGLPLALDHVWLPMALAGPLMEANFSRTALYEELRVRCGVVPERGVEQSRPVTLDRESALRLGLSPGDAAFEIDRRTISGGRPLEWRVSIVRGDRFAFRAEWESPWNPASSRLVQANDRGSDSIENEDQERRS